MTLDIRLLKKDIMDTEISNEHITSDMDVKWIKESYCSLITQNSRTNETSVLAAYRNFHETYGNLEQANKMHNILLSNADEAKEAKKPAKKKARKKATKKVAKKATKKTPVKKATKKVAKKATKKTATSNVEVTAVGAGEYSVKVGNKKYEIYKEVIKGRKTPVWVLYSLKGDSLTEVKQARTKTALVEYLSE